MNRRYTDPKYRRVNNSSKQQPKNENEIRVSTKGSMITCVQIAKELLQDKKFDTILIQGVENAIPKCILIAEIVRGGIPDLIQINNTKQIEIIDEYEPIEEGLDTVQRKRQLPALEIQLLKLSSLNKSQLDDVRKHYGFQDVVPKDQQDPAFFIRITSEGQGSEKRGGERRRQTRGGYRGGNSQRDDRTDQDGDQQQNQSRDRDENREVTKKNSGFDRDYKRYDNDRRKDSRDFNQNNKSYRRDGQQKNHNIDQRQGTSDRRQGNSDRR